MKETLLAVLRGVLGIYIAIDAVLLGAATRVAHWFQRLTGRTNFFLARAALLICVASVAATLFDFYFKHTGRKLTWVLVPFELFALYYLSVLTTRCREAEERQATEAGTRALDLRFWMPAWFRLLFLYFAAFEVAGAFRVWGEFSHPVIVALDGSYSTGFVLHLYFAAVNPLPPTKGKAREWIEALRTFARPAETAS